MARVSCRSRPISVLLPSSTLPAVMNRSTPRSWGACGRASILSGSAISEISLFLAAFHGDLGGLVVHASRAALGDRRQHGLRDDLGGRARRRFDRAGATDVAYRAEAHRQLFRLFALARRRDLGHRNEQPVPAHDHSAVRVVDRGYREPLALYVLPDVELGPVADGEHAHVLAHRDPGVVEIPQLRALILRIPLTELVAERKNALFRARFF